MEFADVDPDELASACRCAWCIRIKDVDAKRGFRRYFWKATPVRGAATDRRSNAWPQASATRSPSSAWAARVRRALGRGADDLMLEAFNEAMADAGIEPKQIEAAWSALHGGEQRRQVRRRRWRSALRLPASRVTRVENMCATGTEALRGAAYAVAAGAFDIALALGVEKLKDTGYGGLPVRTRGVTNDLWLPNALGARRISRSSRRPTAPSTASSKADLKRAMAHVSWKSHANGALNPKAHLRKPITKSES